jgi:WD40 repeat protein
MNSGGSAHTLIGHDTRVLCVRWSPAFEYQIISSAYIFIETTDGYSADGVKLWDIRKARSCIKTIDSGTVYANLILDVLSDVNSMTYTSDGTILLAITNKMCVKIVDPIESRVIATHDPLSSSDFNTERKMVLPCITNTNHVLSPLVFVPTHKRMIICFDMYTGRIVKKLVGHYNKVNCVCLRDRYQVWWFLEFL